MNQKEKFSIYRSTWVLTLHLEVWSSFWTKVVEMSFQLCLKDKERRFILQGKISLELLLHIEKSHLRWFEHEVRLFPEHPPILANSSRQNPKETQELEGLYVVSDQEYFVNFRMSWRMPMGRRISGFPSQTCYLYGSTTVTQRNK